MTDHAHLSPATTAVISNPPYERIEYIRKDRWIDYPRARYALGLLDQMILHSTRRRRTGVLFVGPTNNGKTMIIERFMKKHPGADDPKQESAEVPCVFVEAPPKPDLSAFYNSVLTYLGAPFKASDSFSWKEIQVKMLMRKLRIRMLIIDEFQHLGSSRQDHLLQFFNGIKNLSTELRIPIVCVGTKPALRLVRSDPQIENRVPPIAIPHWKNDKDFRMLLNTIERNLPLKQASRLASDSIANKILAMCDGDKKSESYGATIGEIVALLEAAAVKAIESGKEKIDEKLLDEVSYRAPSKRHEIAERQL